MRNNVYVKLIARLADFKVLFTFATISIFLIAGFDALVPRMTSWAIDNIIVVRQYELLVPFITVLVVLIILFSGIIYIMMRLLGHLQVKFSEKLRNDLFEKIQRLQIDYFAQNDDGWIIARITGDVSKLADVMSWQFIDVIYFLFFFVIIMTSLLFINLKIGLLVVILYPALVLLIYFIRNKVLKNYRLVRAQNSIMTSKYNELINGIQTIKTMNIEDKNLTEFTQDNQRMFKYSRRALLYSALFGPLTLTVGYLIYEIGLNVSGSEFLTGVITLGEVTLIMSYILRLIESTNELTAILAEFQNAQANAERIFKLLEEPIAIQDTKEVIEKYGDIFQPIVKTNLKGEVSFENIDFSYPNSNNLFTDFNLHVKAGQSVALVGETGSGKTTIINLLTRLYEPTSGVIKIDGINIQERNINFIHHNIGHVLQRPQLFTGTILENIRYNSGASKEKIIKTVELLGFKDVINNLENGYDSEVGEGGARLSVGEKQLISFARAIVNDPRIIVMDEATSSIDTHSEELIQKATDELLKDRTSFIIAHRLSTIKRCDIIVVLKKGKIIEMGSHQELMNNEGYYYRLNNS